MIFNRAFADTKISGEVVIPESVVYMETTAFYGAKFKRVLYPSYLKSFKNDSKYGDFKTYASNGKELDEFDNWYRDLYDFTR